MLRKEQYRDLNKYYNTKRRQQRRYYRQTVCGPKKWTEDEDALVLLHVMTDRELSAKIGHSMAAIQKRRTRLKNAI